jgi:hypothetical protein
MKSATLLLLLTISCAANDKECVGDCENGQGVATSKDRTKASGADDAVQPAPFFTPLPLCPRIVTAV